MQEKTGELKRWQVIFMAICTGLIVANIYYCQPLVVMISKDFGVTETRGGSITFFTQAGYALGLLFFVPLGDKFERRTQILVTSALAVASLITAAVSPSLTMLRLSSLLIGFTSIIPQLVLPLAAHLSPVEKRGRIIGSIMSGLLVGILLSRTFSGFIGAWLGWRSMFWIAAGITGSLLVAMRFIFPQSYPSFRGNYISLMRSLLYLLKSQPLLREASAINALSFAGFGIFWTTMVLHLSKAPFLFHSDRIGLFGLAAAAGALMAPLIGGAADQGNPRRMIGYGIAFAFISFLIFRIFSESVFGIITGIILLDLGLQCIHVSNQTRIYTLLPEARNRLNTVFMTISFIGTSLGSAIGLWIWDKKDWPGVCLAGSGLVLSAFIIYLATSPGKFRTGTISTNNF